MELFDANKRELSKLQLIVDQILALRDQTAALSDAALHNRTWALRSRLSQGQTTDDILPEAYAVVREASRRVLGMEHFPVQLMGGIVLHQGRIAEMCTGEGKTLVATLPSYLNALTGKGVHVITVNDYLAKRDRELMGRVHEFLGLSVGLVLSGMDTAARQAAYSCDITYVTNSELGFDHLRDNMATHQEQLVQRDFHYCIIDEVDSILIDEARMPLIISGESLPNTKLYEVCNVLAKRLSCGGEPQQVSKLDSISGICEVEHGDFLLSEKDKQVYLTDAGIRRVERFFRIESIAMPGNIKLMYHMDLALRANYLMVRDRDYVVKDGKVYIVDEQTGRISEGRQFAKGLHQAIEAKERVRIQKENRTSASVTYQNFFRQYAKISGMTGTGKTEEEEFIQVYGMDIVTIPTNRPILRRDRADLVFRTRKEKLEAVCQDVTACRKTRRPILVGTASISESEQLSQLFTEKGISHHLLNAKNHESEAAIVAKAGMAGAVTIATNMAGRGTDIKLEEASRAAGGLLVIGTERSHSRRVDRQLQGRSGRQGDPGESRFYLSLEDPLLKLFGSSRLETVYRSLGVEEGCGIRNLMLSKAVEQAQKQVEHNHFAQRRQMLEFDQVLNEQRTALYGQRRRLLLQKDISPQIRELLTRAAEDITKVLFGVVPEDQIHPSALDLANMVLPPNFNIKDFTAEMLKARLVREFHRRYEHTETAFQDPRVFQDRTKRLLVKTMDLHWMDHLEEMEQLRQGIWLVSYAQKDPLVEYQICAYSLFDQMNRNILYDTAVSLLRHSEVKVRT